MDGDNSAPKHYIGKKESKFHPASTKKDSAVNHILTQIQDKRGMGSIAVDNSSGKGNEATGTVCVVGRGLSNSSKGTSSIIGGGEMKTAKGFVAVIVGGYSTIGGG